MGGESIFDRCGGFATVGAVVMALYEKVLKSPITGPYFDDADIPALMVHQTKFVASIMGGPASFNDAMLVQCHRERGVSGEAFDEMVRLFHATLQEFDLSAKDVETLMVEIRARRSLIVKTAE